MEHGKHAVGIGRTDRVCQQLVLLTVGHFACELLEHVADNHVLGRFGPNRQHTRLAVGDHLDIGHLGCERGLKCLEPLPLGGSHRVHDQLCGFLWRRAGLELLDDPPDRFMVVVRGHHHQPQILRIDRDLGVGNQLLKNRQHVLRRFPHNWMKTQLLGVSPGDLALDLLEDFAYRKMIAGLGPNRQLARLAAGENADVGQLGSQRRLQRLESRPLGGSRRVHDQLAGLLQGHAGLELLNGLLDRLVIGFRGHHHQTLVIRVGGDRRLGCQFGQHAQKVLRGLLNQGMKSQFGSRWIGLLRLQLVERFLDHLVVAGDGQCHQVAGCRVDVQLCLGYHFSQQRQRGSGVGLR